MFDKKWKNSIDSSDHEHRLETRLSWSVIRLPTISIRQICKNINWIATKKNVHCAKTGVRIVWSGDIHNDDCDESNCCPVTDFSNQTRSSAVYKLIFFGLIFRSFAWRASRRRIFCFSSRCPCVDAFTSRAYRHMLAIILTMVSHIIRPHYVHRTRTACSLYIRSKQRYTHDIDGLFINNNY